MNNLFFKKISNENEQLDEIENFIVKSINVFWVNSIFFMEEDYEDFFNILYNFLTDYNNKKFSDYIHGKNKIDIFSKKYLEYISNELITLFEDFEEATLCNFERNLYSFIINYLDNNGTNYYINLILNIQMKNKLTEEELGLISMICLNHNFINDMKDKIRNKINIAEISEQLGLNNYENIVLGQLELDEHGSKKSKKGKKKLNKKNKKKNNNSGHISSNESNKNSKADIINSETDKNVINNNKNDINIQAISKNKENNDITAYNKIESNINNIKSNEICVEEDNIAISNLKKEYNIKKDNLEDVTKEKDKNFCCAEIDNFEIKNKNNRKNIKVNKNEEEIKTVSDNNKNINTGTNEISSEIKINLNSPFEDMSKTINSLKTQFCTLKKEFEEYKLKNEKYKIENEKYKKENDEYKIENEKYKKENDEYKIENEKYKKENDKYKRKVDILNEELKNTKKDLEDLKIIHKSIYFRDVSKFFITKFSDKYEDTKGITSKEVIKNQNY